MSPAHDSSILTARRPCAGLDMVAVEASAASFVGGVRGDPARQRGRWMDPGGCPQVGAASWGRRCRRGCRRTARPMTSGRRRFPYGVQSRNVPEGGRRPTSPRVPRPVPPPDGVHRRRAGRGPQCPGRRTGSAVLAVSAVVSVRCRPMPRPRRTCPVSVVGSDTAPVPRSFNLRSLPRRCRTVRFRPTRCSAGWRCRRPAAKRLGGRGG